jgi:aryl sulfotransferase
VKTLIWLASYPKSGNTWLRVLLSHYLAASDHTLDINHLSIPNAADVTVFDHVGLLSPSELTVDEGDSARVAMYRCLAGQGAGLRWLKIHDAFRRVPTGEWLCPPDVSQSAVYLVRHPADVAISFGYHFGMSTEEAVALMARPNAVIGRYSRLQFVQALQTWSQHVQSWRCQAEIPVVVVRYEDLLQDPFMAFERLLTDLGLMVDSLRVREAVEAARFDRLQKLEATTGFSERAPLATAPFFRAGRADQWRDQMPASLRAQLAADHGSTMADLGYNFGPVE